MGPRDSIGVNSSRRADEWKKSHKKSSEVGENWTIKELKEARIMVTRKMESLSLRAPGLWCGMCEGGNTKSEPPELRLGGVQGFLALTGSRLLPW